MSARRQASTTSLSKYARAHSPDPAGHSDAFCNTFWGLGDGGVDVLFARMRGATRTIDELRNFLKERSLIEEDYAKRLAKLAKQTLGRDEIGELRNSLDTLRQETEKQAGFHIQLAQQMRTDIEGQTAVFSARQAHFKKTFQAQIEKEFKAKQTQESYVNRAREKYESDCLRINSYTAQSTLVQGKDLEKIHLKLERAQQTVQANERDFANFARAFQDTAAKWEQGWKAFCDSCQDLEEERMEFMKDNMWAYANAVSTVCVADDESCERMRLALEQMEPEKDMDNFMRDYGTSNMIPDPPAFVNYTTPDAASASSRPTTHPAQFARSSQRPTPMRPPPPQLQEDEPPMVNTAGVGANGSRRGAPEEGASLSRQPTRGRSSQSQVPPQVTGNGAASSASRQAISQSQQQMQQMQGSFRPPRDPNGEPIDPHARTMIKIGEKAYEVDPSKDPQQQSASRGGLQKSGTMNAPRAGDENDPLVGIMEDLNLNAGSSSSGRRNSVYRQPIQPSGTGPSRKPVTEPAGPSSLSPPGSSGNVAQGSNRRSPDYRNSAEMVVGAYPGPSRPSSPNPPKANFFPSGQKQISPSNSRIPVEGVLQDYQQSFPGERKSTSSRRNSFVASPAGQSSNGHHPGPSQGQNLARPVSREGHAGIGANGRSPSPQPISRSASPMRTGGSSLNHGNSILAPPGGPPAANGAYPARSNSIAHRATSPNTIGIALDPSGNVSRDEMAEMYNRQQQQQQPLQHHHHPYSQQPVQQQQPQQIPSRQASYNANNGMAHAPPQQYPYGMSPAPAPPAAYPVQQPAQPTYTPHPSQPHHPYAQQPYQPPPSQPGYQPQQNGYTNPPANGANAQRGPPVGGGYPGYNQGPPQYGRPGYRAPSPARTPSPQPQPQQGPPPTGQYTEDGRGVLFYVKALYDYAATIEEEFDFQSGDIIAVTATPEDGWWSGELLDEARRQPGRHVFPSNFVCLF